MVRGRIVVLGDAGARGRLRKLAELKTCEREDDVDQIAAERHIVDARRALRVRESISRLPFTLGRRLETEHARPIVDQPAFPR